MPREIHRFDRTVGEVMDLVEDLIASTFGTYNSEYAQRLQRVKIDGVPLREFYAERQHSRSTYYHKNFKEALAVAHMLVQMKLDDEGVNIERRDKPDTAVRFPKRDPIYVEETTVEESGMPFGRHLEEVNLRLEDIVGKDVSLKSFLDAGMMMVKVTDPGKDDRRPAAVLAAEAAQLTSEIKTKVSLLRADAYRYPTLTHYRANVFYSPGLPSQTNVFQRDASWVDPAPPWVEQQILRALAEKQALAAQYDPACRPLWLRMSLWDDHLLPFMARPLAERALLGVDIAPFDRVVVGMSGMEPVVVPPLGKGTAQNG